MWVQRSARLADTPARQASYVSSLSYWLCHLPSWSGLPLSSVLPAPLSPPPASPCTGASFRFHPENSQGVKQQWVYIFFSAKIVLRNREFGFMPSHLVSQKYRLLLFWYGGKQFKGNEYLFHKVRLLANCCSREWSIKVLSCLCFNWKLDNFLFMPVIL